MKADSVVLLKDAKLVAFAEKRFPAMCESRERDGTGIVITGHQHMILNRAYEKHQQGKIIEERKALGESKGLIPGVLVEVTIRGIAVKRTGKILSVDDIGYIRVQGVQGSHNPNLVEVATSQK